VNSLSLFTHKDASLMEERIVRWLRSTMRTRSSLRRKETRNS